MYQLWINLWNNIMQLHLPLWRFITKWVMTYSQRSRWFTTFTSSTLRWNRLEMVRRPLTQRLAKLSLWKPSRIVPGGKVKLQKNPLNNERWVSSQPSCWMKVLIWSKLIRSFWSRQIWSLIVKARCRSWQTTFSTKRGQMMGVGQVARHRMFWPTRR